MGKKPEDNRDVFETALEYGAPIAAMSAFGRAAMRRGIRKDLAAEGTLKKYPKSAKKIIDSYGREGAVIGGIGGAGVGLASNIRNERKKPRK